MAVEQQFSRAAPDTGVVGKPRGPVVVIVLSIITLGVYYLYWYYKINDEMRRYRSFIEVSPGLALLAQFVPIVNWISGYRTAARLRRLEEADQVAPISPVLALVLDLLLGVVYPIYVQYHLNKLWAAAKAPRSQLRSGMPDPLDTQTERPLAQVP